MDLFDSIVGYCDSCVNQKRRKKVSMCGTCYKYHCKPCDRNHYHCANCNNTINVKGGEKYSEIDIFIVCVGKCTVDFNKRKEPFWEK